MNKEIMEIIEPYMQKNIERWCYIQLWNWFAYVYKIVPNWNRTIVLTNGIWNMDLEDIQMDEQYKILWHYDITAVLKYAHDNKCRNYKIQLSDDWDSWVISIPNPDYKTTKIKYKAVLISNKPLHLYTTQENKDLLELLKKLCNNYKK